MSRTRASEKRNVWNQIKTERETQYKIYGDISPMRCTFLRVKNETAKNSDLLLSEKRNFTVKTDFHRNFTKFYKQKICWDVHGISLWTFPVYKIKIIFMVLFESEKNGQISECSKICMFVCSFNSVLKAKIRRFFFLLAPQRCKWCTLKVEKS